MESAKQAASETFSLRQDPVLRVGVIYVGGGASVMKKFGRTKGMNIQYVTDVKANALQIISDRRYYEKFYYLSFESETCRG